MSQLGHEKLRVYQHGVTYVSWVQTVLAGVDSSAAVLDHFDRAAESIIENIANGNSRREKSDRNRYFDVAVGSVLESAACLDVCLCKQLLRHETQAEGKKQLHRIVPMLIRLREAHIGRVQEEGETYAAGRACPDSMCFGHEQLDVYKVALDLVLWVDRVICASEFGGRYSSRLDKGSTAIVLNIAEGNGRFSCLDHRRFVDIAYTAAMKVASTLDMIVARKLAAAGELQGGKELLVRLVPLLLGLRGYLDRSEEPTSASVEGADRNAAKGTTW
ncbi:four helix bundle protein [Verrucomicrobiota bacterium]